MASRLSEDSKASVLLLEAGKSDLEPDNSTQIPFIWTSNLGSEKDWSYSTIPQKFSLFAYKIRYVCFFTDYHAVQLHDVNDFLFLIYNYV